MGKSPARNFKPSEKMLSWVPKTRHPLPLLPSYKASFVILLVNIIGLSNVYGATLVIFIIYYFIHIFCHFTGDAPAIELQVQS